MLHKMSEKITWDSKQNRQKNSEHKKAENQFFKKYRQKMDAYINPCETK